MSTTSSSGAIASPSFQPTRPDHLIAYGFGAGLSPMAPGTMGTLVAIPIYLVLSHLPGLAYLVALAVLIGVGLWACDKVAAEMGEDDPPSIVWDEIVGFLVAMAAAPVVSLAWILMGFLLFRLFDIYKPWPVSWTEKRFKGGLGIMADDLVAGAMTWVVLTFMAMIVSASLGHGVATIAH
ncbi:phosphatidylglycerophosphatase A [Lamprobacter modestohalophilus]|uniref:Phosphatidylglycerophosphatase A n=1 Tax=Lamprobacter modestohalophilus TaxID=1064514 RepID=A0A9X1B310_9GAMM|nr:phosphatidylglycerophosphatase A [Lamprobacter modestohalophilus]MCF7977700.1 phosphatidylglycerophosphatase A [Chromatiaceae bacterium]MBK1617968.1 phosphatidylglycerophosphatase A [Lamprobacter modestohalophilus]MCF7996435.1 phosphatidylglycerophosphatase A [Chromatiaceae bacterium]MCF8004840.1 phosphatidylglycerophosphatase A [Chromatiaceae bacterium]MCF8015353.1 phosphatidylglycerophosphatase A [Chromatiaceae bacterium]